MPHFIIDSSEDIIHQDQAEEIMATVYSVAVASGLFALNDVKARLRPCPFYQLGEGKNNFIHFHAYIP